MAPANNYCVSSGSYVKGTDGPGNWESVALNTERLRVDGGWLYKVTTWSSTMITADVTFVPDGSAAKLLLERDGG